MSVLGLSLRMIVSDGKTLVRLRGLKKPNVRRKGRGTGRDWSRMEVVGTGEVEGVD